MDVWGWCVVALVLFKYIRVMCKCIQHMHSIVLFFSLLYSFLQISWEVNSSALCGAACSKCVPIDKLQIGKTPLIYFARVKWVKTCVTFQSSSNFSLLCPPLLASLLWNTKNLPRCSTMCVLPPSPITQNIT